MSTSLIVTYIFFFIDTATTDIYTLSLHDALPISRSAASRVPAATGVAPAAPDARTNAVSFVDGDTSTNDTADRKSTRLNSSHQIISYAVFCLKKKNSN